MQLASVYAAGPDQTRVAERSIGDDNRQLVQPVVDEMMVAHLADSIRAAISTQRNRDNHVGGIETGVFN